MPNLSSINTRPWLDNRYRHIVLLIDGAADRPQASLGNQTPLMAAHMPHLSELCRIHPTKSFSSIPSGCQSGSEVANLTILGYEDVAEQIDGRASLEALALDIVINSRELAYRCDFHNFPSQPIHCDFGRLIKGLAHRHIFITKEINTEQSVLEDRLIKVLRDSGIAGGCRLWSPSGPLSSFPPFVQRYNMAAGMVAAAPVIRGIGKLLGFETPTVNGATGDVDTDLSAKMRAAATLARRFPFTFVHVEGTDEASHRRDPLAKKDLLERIDSELVGPLVDYAREQTDTALTILTDHYTDSQTGKHLSIPVPYLFIPPIQ